MKIKFLGTKGEIEEQTSKHKYHSSLLLISKNFKLLIDHGLKSLALKKIKPDAILITHAHPDHFIWLKKDEEYEKKIYVTKETLEKSRFKKNFELMKRNKWFSLGPFKILAYPVVHSINFPAVGFKIKNKKAIIYNPDVVMIKKKSVLKNADLYIGDGSSIKTNLVRKKGNQFFGHARVTTQISWCQKYKIKNIIFTHLGKEALRFGDKKLEKWLNEKNPEMNIKIARDGMELKIPNS